MIKNKHAQPSAQDERGIQPPRRLALAFAPLRRLAASMRYERGRAALSLVLRRRAARTIDRSAPLRGSAPIVTGAAINCISRAQRGAAHLAPLNVRRESDYEESY